MSAPDAEHAPHLNVTRARQGRRGVHMFWVLVISTVLAAAILGFIWLVQSGPLSRVSGQAAADQPTAATFDGQAVALPQAAPEAQKATPVSR